MFTKPDVMPFAKLKPCEDSRGFRGKKKENYSYITSHLGKHSNDIRRFNFVIAVFRYRSWRALGKTLVMI